MRACTVTVNDWTSQALDRRLVVVGANGRPV